MRKKKKPAVWTPEQRAFVAPSEDSGYADYGPRGGRPKTGFRFLGMGTAQRATRAKNWAAGASDLLLSPSSIVDLETARDLAAAAARVLADVVREEHERRALDRSGVQRWTPPEEDS